VSREPPAALTVTDHPDGVSAPLLVPSSVLISPTCTKRTVCTPAALCQLLTYRLFPSKATSPMASAPEKVAVQVESASVNNRVVREDKSLRQDCAERKHRT
jgi:hypothetical protein